MSVASSPETAWKIATYFPKTSNALVWFLRQLTWPQLLAILTGPVCFGKNVINCVQFWKASKIVCGLAAPTRLNTDSTPLDDSSSVWIWRRGKLRE